jgi:SAM-dependent methyltransferase
MTYQNKWINGAVAEKGYRECAPRYEIVRDFCRQRFTGPFSVCDIGANLCYFGLRLTEDFPLCSVMAFEFHPLVLKHAEVAIKSNNTKRLILLNRKLGLDDARTLASCAHFDVVLALSVIHHLPGSFDDWLTALRGLGKYLIAEFAVEDSPRVAAHKGYHVPNDAVILGYGESHKKIGVRRPIVLIKGEKNA